MVAYVTSLILCSSLQGCNATDSTDINYTTVQFAERKYTTKGKRQLTQDCVYSEVKNSSANWIIYYIKYIWTADHGLNVRYGHLKGISLLFKVLLNTLDAITYNYLAIKVLSAVWDILSWALKILHSKWETRSLFIQKSKKSRENPPYIIFKDVTKYE